MRPPQYKEVSVGRKAQFEASKGKGGYVFLASLTVIDKLNIHFLFELHNNYHFLTLSHRMFTYPFARMMGGSDPFDPYDCPLPTFYDPSCPFKSIQDLTPKQEVTKLEEPTSPGYAVQEAPPELVKEELLLPPRQCKGEKGKKIVKGPKDDDYKPYRRPSKGGRDAVKQKQDRNLIPNTVHHLLAFVQKQFKSSFLVEKMFPLLSPNPTYTVSRYYNFHRMLRGQINNYVNEEAMRIITEPGTLPTDEYTQEEQDFYCKLSRIVVRKFLKVEAVLMILRSRKVRRENILDHLSVQRYLYENMLAVTSP